MPASTAARARGPTMGARAATAWARTRASSWPSARAAQAVRATEARWASSRPLPHPHWSSGSTGIVVAGGSGRAGGTVTTGGSGRSGSSTGGVVVVPGAGPCGSAGSPVVVVGGGGWLVVVTGPSVVGVGPAVAGVVVVAGAVVAGAATAPPMTNSDRTTTTSRDSTARRLPLGRGGLVVGGGGGAGGELPAEGFPLDPPVVGVVAALPQLVVGAADIHVQPVAGPDDGGRVDGGPADRAETGPLRGGHVVPLVVELAVGAGYDDVYPGCGVHGHSPRLFGQGVVVGGP